MNENEKKIEELQIIVESATEAIKHIFNDIKAERVPYLEGMRSLTPLIFGRRELNERIRILKQKGEHHGSND